MLSALNTAELSGQLARLRLAKQIFVGEIYVVLIARKVLLRKMPSKMKHPCYKTTTIVTSLDCSKLLDFLFSSFFSALFFPLSLPRLFTFHCCVWLVGYLVSIKNL